MARSLVVHQMQAWSIADWTRQAYKREHGLAPETDGLTVTERPVMGQRMATCRAIEGIEGKFLTQVESQVALHWDCFVDRGTIALPNEAGNNDVALHAFETRKKEMGSEYAIEAVVDSLSKEEL